MNPILTLIKNYISTGSFLVLSLLVYLFSDKNPYAQWIVEHALPENGKPLAFITFMGLIIVYECGIRHWVKSDKNSNEIRDSIAQLHTTVEKGLLISDVNSAFTEFKGSGREHITGEYYIKEILTLNDTRERLEVNSYTQNKLDYLISRIKHD